MSKNIWFFAYPNTPAEVKQTVRVSAKTFNEKQSQCEIVLWEQLDIPGRFIAS